MAHDDGNGTDNGGVIGPLLVGGASWVALDTFGPLAFEPQINWPAALSAAVLAVCTIKVSAAALKNSAAMLDKISAKKARGDKGDAGWAKNLRELGKDVIQFRDWGPYWGTFAGGLPIIGSRGREIIADYPSAAVSFGTAGSGKGAGVLLPTALAIHEPKILTCFKGVNTSALMQPLMERGERFFAINLGNIFPEIIGTSACYNPLDIITDDFEMPSGISDVTADCDGLSLQLYPEPKTTQGDSSFWHGGTVDMISMAVQQTILVHGRGANLGLVNQLLMDRERFLQEMLWASGRLLGNPAKDEELVLLPAMPIEDSHWTAHHDPATVDQYIDYYRTKAGETADILADRESKIGGSFLRGAISALAPFNITTRAQQVMSHSSFRFRDIRDSDDIINVSIVIDASRKEAQTPIAGLIQWAAMTELKRCDNKDRKVYFLCDETTNFRIHDLPGFLTWGREYGLVIHLFIQSMAAFRNVYGKEAANTLLSETFIKQFLPGQRDPEMLELIEKLLADVSYVARSNTDRQNEAGIQGTSYSEHSKPLMSRDEIRRTDKTILFIGNKRPALTKLPPYAAIVPFRDQMGINPFFGKPWRLPVKLRLRRRDGFLAVRVWKWLFGKNAEAISKGEKP